MIKYKFTENKLYSQFFSFEILDYYDSIATDENFEWIENYFNILMKDENINTEKFNIHHIRPCCTFKDKEHKNRRETEKLGNEFNGNLIKLSIYNHFFAHFYLWKIFNNRDLKNAFQRMCGQGKYINNLTKEELNNIARLKENCAKKNKTDKEKKEWVTNKFVDLLESKYGEIDTFEFCSDTGAELDNSTIDKIVSYFPRKEIRIYYNINTYDGKDIEDFDTEDLIQFYDKLVKWLKYKESESHSK